MKLRRSLVGKIDRYAERAQERNDKRAAEALAQIRTEALFVESTVDLCLYAAELADHLIYGATRGTAAVDYAAAQEALELHDLLAAHIPEIDRMIDAGSDTTETLVAVRQLVIDTGNGLGLALDVASDRTEHDIDGADRVDYTSIDVEFDAIRTAIYGNAEALRAVVLYICGYRPRLLLDGRCRRRGPPAARRTSNYARCAPLGANAPPCPAHSRTPERVHPHLGRAGTVKAT